MPAPASARPALCALAALALLGCNSGPAAHRLTSWEEHPLSGSQTAWVSKSAATFDDAAFFGIGGTPSNPGDVYSIIEVRGTSVTRHSQLPPDVSPHLIFGADPAALHVLGSEPGGFRLLRWRSGAWVELARYADNTYSFWSAEAETADGAWLTGISATAPGGQDWNALVARWNGAALAPLSDPKLEVSGAGYDQVAVMGPDEIWFNGQYGDHALRWTRSAGLTRVEYPRVVARRLARAGSELLLAMDDGLHRWNGTDFGELLRVPERSLVWTGGRSADDYWTYEADVGCLGGAPSDRLVHWNGAAFIEHQTFYCETEPNVAAVANRVYTWDNSGLFTAP